MIFTIKPNKHKSRYLPILSFTQIINFSLKFIKIPNSTLRGQINKVYGLGFLPYHHHRNSIRLGFTVMDVENQVIGLYFYGYVKKKRIEKFLCLTTINTLLHIQLGYRDGRYYVSIFNDKRELLKKHSVINNSIHFPFTYYLFPYIGGKNTSKSETKIEIIHE